MNENYLNIADICHSTRALGPGLRAAIWVQGCPIHCKGCIAPDWIPFKPATILTPEEAGDKLLQNPDIKGISISGGEPMMQAKGLTTMLRYVRKKKNLHVICFTGFRYEELIKWNENKKIKELFDEIDILIDGPFIEKMNNGKTFAGSSNQRIIDISHRKFPEMHEWALRKMEFHIRKRNMLAVGIPPIGWERDLFHRFSSNGFVSGVEKP